MCIVVGDNMGEREGGARKRVVAEHRRHNVVVGLCPGTELERTDWRWVGCLGTRHGWN